MQSASFPSWRFAYGAWWRCWGLSSLSGHETYLRDFLDQGRPGICLFWGAFLSILSILLSLREETQWL